MATKKSFEKIRKMLSEIPDIDCGGCGISALAMYRWLKKNFATAGYVYDDEDDNDAEREAEYDKRMRKIYVRVAFIMGYNSTWKLKINSAYIDGDKDHSPMACSHAGLVVGFNDEVPIIVDCEQHFDVLNYTCGNVFYDEKIMVDSINNVSDWNTDFDRKKYVPIIAEKLGISLSDVKLSLG